MEESFLGYGVAAITLDGTPAAIRIDNHTGYPSWVQGEGAAILPDLESAVEALVDAREKLKPLVDGKTIRPETVTLVKIFASVIRVAQTEAEERWFLAEKILREMPGPDRRVVLDWARSEFGPRFPSLAQDD